MNPHAAPPEGPRIPGAQYKGLLGAGGFADVFLYENDMPRREVAVKVIRRGAGEQDRRRFEAEANLMARMSSHPSILSVYGAGTVEGDRNYLVMEYCPPPHLGKRARAQALSVPRALEVAIQICGAVETIHRAGYLHRDIKPANILVTSFNRPVLTDFGIAAPMGECGDDVGGASPPWAPPEQLFKDGRPTPASDVYSLAATVYTLLAGRSPHVDPAGGRSDQLSIMERISNQPVPPIGRQDVPAQLERVLVTAMAKRPENRYSSAIAFARALQQVQTDLQLPVTPLDVMEEEVVQDSDPGQSQDATALRPVTSIDPDGPTGTVPAATNPVVGVNPDATRFAPRRIDAQGRGDQHSEQTRERFTVPGGPAPAVAGPGLRGQAPPGPGGAPEAPDASGATMTSEQLHGREQGACRPASVHSREWQPLGPQVVPPERDDDRLGARPVLLGVVALLLVLGIGGVAAWSSMREEGGSAPTAAPSSQAPVAGPPPGVSTVPGVEDLAVSLVNGEVEVTWGYAAGATGVTFLYRISDPAEPHPVQETTSMRATIHPVSSRTCVEVVARDAGGAISEEQVACIDTPGAQEEQK